MTTTQAESDDQIMLTRLANSRRSDIQIQIEKLRGELGAATAEKESETEKRENIIQQLKDDLATVEQVRDLRTKTGESWTRRSVEPWNRWPKKIQNQCWIIWKLKIKRFKGRNRNSN